MKERYECRGKGWDESWIEEKGWQGGILVRTRMEDEDKEDEWNQVLLHLFIGQDEFRGERKLEEERR